MEGGHWSAYGLRNAWRSNDGEARQAGRDRDLDIDVERFDALKGHRVDMGDHAGIPPQTLFVVEMLLCKDLGE